MMASFKKYYRGGMISLIFLPILFIPYLQKEYDKPKYHQVILKVNLPVRENRDFIFSLPKIRKLLKHAQIESVTLDTNSVKVREHIVTSIKNLSELQNNSFFLRS